MLSRYYDAVVLGRSLGALTAAALLARRDFRVLVLGQRQPPPRYGFERHLLRRRAFTLLFDASPVWRRVLHELAQSPRFKQRTEALDPMWTLLAPGRRVEVPPSMELYSHEVDREFPEVRQLVDELYTGFASVNAAADAVLEKEAVWPPGTFWERFETGRAASNLPFVHDAAPADPLAKFPVAHAYRDMTLVPVQFATHQASLGDPLSAFAVARLHGAWTRGVRRLLRGEEELTEFLVDRITAHGGECALERRAQTIVVKNGVAAGVLEDGVETPTGAGAILCDGSGEDLAELTRGEGITERARNDWPRLSIGAGRFVASLVVKSKGLPDALGEEAFVVPRHGQLDPRHPPLHLQRIDLASFSELERPAAEESLLVAEMILPTRGSLTLLEARAAILETLRQELPFIDEHLLVLDSPHDGLPLHDMSHGQRRDIERIHLRGASTDPEPLEPLWTVEPPGYLGLAGEPIRGPIPSTYLVGSTVLPALGQEGQLLAAWSAARIITRRDRRRQRLRQKMWTKIETT